MKKKVILASLFALTFSFLFITTSFAYTADENLKAIEGATGNQALYIWDILKAVIGPVGGAALAWYGIKMLFDGERGMEEAKKRFITLIVVFICIYGAGVIFGQIRGWFPDTIASVNIPDIT